MKTMIWDGRTFEVLAAYKKRPGDLRRVLAVPDNEDVRGAVFLYGRKLRLVIRTGRDALGVPVRLESGDPRAVIDFDPVLLESEEPATPLPEYGDDHHASVFWPGDATHERCLVSHAPCSAKILAQAHVGHAKDIDLLLAMPTPNPQSDAAAKKRARTARHNGRRSTGRPLTDARLTVNAVDRVLKMRKHNATLSMKQACIYAVNELALPIKWEALRKHVKAARGPK